MAQGQTILLSGSGTRIGFLGAGSPGDQTVYVFYTSATITPGKTVQAVTLPAGGTIPAGGGRISGIHISRSAPAPYRRREFR